MFVLLPENTYIYSAVNQQAYDDFRNDTTHPKKCLKFALVNNNSKSLLKTLLGNMNLN